MTEAADRGATLRTMDTEDHQEPELRVLPDDVPGDPLIPSGVAALDERMGGLESGGIYLVSGTPGPAKLVMALQFLHVGISRGEKVAFLTAMDPSDVLDVSRAWGSVLDRAWAEGQPRRSLSVILTSKNDVRDKFVIRIMILGPVVYA